MTELKILAVGAMALLIAAYGATGASGTNLKRTELHRIVAQNHDGHVDGFDLRH